MSFPDLNNDNEFTPAEDENQNDNNIYDNFMQMNNPINMASSDMTPTMGFSDKTQEIDEEEQKRIEARKQEEDERRKKIEEKINYELNVKTELREKAVQYVNEFEEYIYY